VEGEQMHCYMTSGTGSYLEALAGKHPELQFRLMTAGDQALLYYENAEQNIFESGRAYEAIISVGNLETSGYSVMNHIPVLEEGQAIFEDRFKQRRQKIESAPGFQAFRLLRPDEGHTYIAFTQWQSKEAFTDWKNSSDFQQAHANRAKPPAYYADRPFATSYQMVDIQTQK